MKQLDVNIGWRVGSHAGKAKTIIPSGISAIIGKSGAGKTTFAKLLCGLIKPEKGEISLDDQCLYGSGRNIALPPQARRIGYVPQGDSLFPHLSVGKNIAFAAASKQTTDDDNKIIDALGITHLLDRMPGSLSGGEQRRVAIARAIAANPRLLILDEPTNGLDAVSRQNFVKLVQDIHRETNISILIISHRMDDIIDVAGHVLLIEDQKVKASGTLEEVSTYPLAVDLMGVDNITSLLVGRVTSNVHGLDTIEVDKQTIYARHAGIKLESPLNLRIRAGDVAISLDPVKNSSIKNQLHSVIKNITPIGNTAIITLELKDSQQQFRAAITVQSLDQLKLSCGQDVTALIKAVSIRERGI